MQRLYGQIARMRRQQHIAAHFCQRVRCHIRRFTGDRINTGCGYLSCIDRIDHRIFIYQAAPANVDENRCLCSHFVKGFSIDHLIRLCIVVQMQRDMELPRTQWYSNHADKVLDGGKVIGIATNRIFSQYFRKTISHCSIDTEYAQMGREVVVVWGEPGHRQKHIRATVAPSPFKEDNRYIDLHNMPKELK